MEGQELRDGKARVRLHLIEPLVRGGLVRRRSQKQEDHEKVMASLEARLAYMLPDRLEALAEVVERYAGGKHKNTWPDEVQIMHWARRLQEPPASVSRLVRSYLQSAAGEAAKDGGYLVELFVYLRKFGAPPNTFALEQIRKEAGDNLSRMEAIRRDQREGRAAPRELNELQGYMDTRRRALDIINAKAEGAAA